MGTSPFPAAEEPRTRNGRRLLGWVMLLAGLGATFYGVVTLFSDPTYRCSGGGCPPGAAPIRSSDYLGMIAFGGGLLLSILSSFVLIGASRQARMFGFRPKVLPPVPLPGMPGTGGFDQWWGGASGSGSTAAASGAAMIPLTTAMPTGSPLTPPDPTASLAAGGVGGTAVVRTIRDTGVNMNGSRLFVLGLDVNVTGRPQYQLPNHTVWVPTGQVDRVKQGATVPVRAHPLANYIVAIDWSA